ncbi:MAG: ASKHA domain-containing protein, partial [Chloroflexota bacterium]|nr:ASKHA domain-containing protein [Chloroflexota bacterium]
TTPQRTQVEGLNIDLQPDPLITSAVVELIPPSLEAPQADAANLKIALLDAGVEQREIDYFALCSLPNVIRQNDWQAKVALRKGEVVAVASPAAQWLGLAVDIGTTKIAGYLVDLVTGQVLASKGVMNPQISYGEDLISRIVAASESGKGSRKLQGLLVDALSQLAETLAAETGHAVEEIVDAVVVGNTAIHHLFLGLPVKQLGLSPYTPVVDKAVDVKAREIGLQISPGAYVHLLPNVAGYVGADHVAMLLATNMDEADETTLAIDIGTNTEICLKHKGKMTSVSCASGPAFEGAHIKHGMRASDGAIEYVRFDNGKLDVQTIGGTAPTGICGSGLLDAVAQLRLHEIIDAGGRLGDHALMQAQGGAREFILADRLNAAPITLSQRDVRELQLAKAAIRMGILTLVEDAGIAEPDIQKVIIAGAFGTFLDVDSAITIGMLPDLPRDRFEQVGNAAGTGARMALISNARRERASSLAGEIRYIELSRVPNFNMRFAEATFL